MTEDIPEYVFTDCARIYARLRENVRRLALFGSILNKPLEVVNDIDIACFVHEISLPDALKAVREVKLTHPLRSGSANGSYNAAPMRDPNGEKDYHVIFLNDIGPNPTFMHFNKGRMYFIPIARLRKSAQYMV